MTSQTTTSTQRHILAINDSHEVLEIFRLLLEEEGYRVTTMRYAFKEMAEIRLMKPDLIILDYMWAEEDSGWAMLQMLKLDRTTGAIPIILCTGAKKQVEELDGQLATMNVTVVLKPFDIDALLNAITRRLDGTYVDQATSSVETETGGDAPVIRAIA